MSSGSREGNSSSAVESSAKRQRIAKIDSTSSDSSRSTGTLAIQSQTTTTPSPWTFWPTGSQSKTVAAAAVATKLSLQTSVNAKELVPLLTNSVSVVNSTCKLASSTQESNVKPTTSGERHGHFILLPDPNTLCSSSATSVNTPQITLTGPSWPGFTQELETLNAAFEGSLSGLVDLTAAASPFHVGKYPSQDGSGDDCNPGNSHADSPGHSLVSTHEMMDFVKRQSSVTGNNEHFFQYILMAPTSAAIRLHEESLTYINQAQSYEIKCKRLGTSSVGTAAKCFKSIIRVGFHDRRQKFQEKELLEQWTYLHKSERLIDLDLPMSYGIYNVKVQSGVNSVEFYWDTTKQTSAFVKINCISTEFTAKKHGGEKGVPFRMQVDTFQVVEGEESKHVHSAYAQIKVFKTKGADRKNKTDRDKAEKKGDKFQERYQPAYDYTILTELFPLDIYEFEGGTAPPDGSLPIKLEHPNGCPVPESESGLSSQDEASSPTLSTDEPQNSEILHIEAGPSETADWLRKNRFSHFLKTFANFQGADLLRLGKDDLIKICGVADGIRLFNALQHKQICPKLTLYLCQPGAPAYHAVFLFSLTLRELVYKVCCAVLQMDSNQILDVYYEGPGDINVLVTDEVVQNMANGSRYTIDLMKSQNCERGSCRMLLKVPPS